MRPLLVLCIFLASIISSCASSDADFISQVESEHGKLFIEFCSTEEGHVTQTARIQLQEVLNTDKNVSFLENTWMLTATTRPVTGLKEAYRVKVDAKLKDGEAHGISIGLVLVNDTWDTENYVLMPGAVYNGNRYRATLKRRGVPTEIAIRNNPGEGPLISNVPRLSLYPHESKLQQLSGDLSVPSVGYHSPEKGKGIFFITPQGNESGDYSFKVWEDRGHEQADITIRIPGVREDSVFKGGGNMFFPSPDDGADLSAGESIRLDCNVYLFDAPDIQSLFDYFTSIRKDVSEDDTLPAELPFSAAWKILETKYNSQNWVEAHGYYSVGMRESMYQDWQTGWTGGMNALYPLITEGSDSTRARALRTFDFLFDTISPSGLFYDVFYDGEWRLTEGSSFLRRNSDALYFILKSFEQLRLNDPDFAIPENWLQAVRGCAGAYMNLWERHGEFGQWVDYQTGSITVPGTASNGIAAGALALCSQFFEEESYREVAEAAAEKYYLDFVKNGVTNGGPGDIYQGIDSESAFGLLESFVVLYEVTGKDKWLQYAEDVANQCASWVVSYNFRFPEKSTFAKMDMKTNGTVIANVQNKHSAPGICSLSGNSLFKLYRYTQNKFYLCLIRDIARTIPQYMSREDRPIPDVRPDVTWPVMPPGWINERVNLSDWEERGNPGDIARGEIFGGSTWSEVAFLNTWAEIPGIYIVRDKQEITVVDHLKAEFLQENIVKISNPTQFSATVKIFIEDSDHQNTILDPGYMMDCLVLEVLPGEAKEIVLQEQ